MIQGADPIQLQALATSLQARSDQYETANQRIHYLLRTLRWDGADAERFRHAYRTNLAPKLAHAAASLNDASDELRRNAAQQIQASGSGSNRLSSGGRLFPGLPLPEVPGFRLPLPLWPWIPRGGMPLPGGWSRFPEDAPGLKDYIQSVVANAITAGEALDIASQLAGLKDTADTYRLVTMIGLTNVGMRHSDTVKGFNYFRGAKGGFTKALNAKPMKVPWLDAGLNGLYMAEAGLAHGVGSSEFAVEAVDGVLGTAAAFVPGGGIAYDAGKFIGDTAYNYTPLGGFLEDSSPTNVHFQDATSAMNDADAALARKDFDAVRAANERATEAARRGREESEGWSGMGNAAATVVYHAPKRVATNALNGLKSLNPF